MTKTILEKLEQAHIQPYVDLSGPDGNAYCLLALASRIGKALGKDTEAIHKRMTSGDYENLLAVFQKEFGKHVVLLR
jgi:hypothetical protein